MSKWLRRLKKNKDVKLHQRIRKVRWYDPTYGISHEEEILEGTESE